MAVRTAEPRDVERMLDLAAAKREQYRDNAWPFQQPAMGARDAQRPFFLAQLERHDVVALVASEPEADVIAMLIGRLGAGPPPFASWADALHVDDFAVDRAELWMTSGRALLLEAARRAADRGARRLVVVTGSEAIDPPKRATLLECGFVLEARWWIKSVDRDAKRGCEAHEHSGFRAVTSDAPPVYDPGGAVSLVLELDDAADIAAIEDHAAASGAALVVVPLDAGRVEVGRSLATCGFAVGSEWYSGATEMIRGSI